MHEEISYSTTTFSSKGVLVQCEKALAAAKNGALSLGIQAANGTVLASLKKRPSPLVVSSRVQKVHKVCDSIISTYSGLSADFRAALEIAREIADDFLKVYGKYPPLETFVREFSKSIQEKTQKAGLRPIGCVCLFAGAEERAGLYHIDPSGSIKSARTFAVGRFFRECAQFLERRCSEEIEINDAVVIAALAMREFTETAISEEDVDICTVTSEGIHAHSQEEIREIFRSMQ
ncbi:20S proteasome subunit alpha 2 [Nematocida major]|uniref:20S proteasome subunit alpha 2 n=1 Tax=Nematocida major TaxID=1912982 RepID=UPI00200874C4|nr:20S proteasome subunit alpha 2 [Nematocida major]KAH9385754.1 20S proteasome subunit alpha 2 [Nematocida major]